MLNGKDILNLGFPEGPIVGLALACVSTLSEKIKSTEEIVVILAGILNSTKRRCLSLDYSV